MFNLKSFMDLFLCFGSLNVMLIGPSSLKPDLVTWLTWLGGIQAEPLDFYHSWVLKKETTVMLCSEHPLRNVQLLSSAILFQQPDPETLSLFYSCYCHILPEKKALTVIECIAADAD